MCRWVQAECRSLGENDAPEVDPTLTAAVAALRDRPVLFKYCAEEVGINVQLTGTLSGRPGLLWMTCSAANCMYVSTVLQQNVSCAESWSPTVLQPDFVDSRQSMITAYIVGILRLQVVDARHSPLIRSLIAPLTRAGFSVTLCHLLLPCYQVAGARHGALFQRFIVALTRGGPGGLPRPIEIHAHDPRRYVADMLAWVHQVCCAVCQYHRRVACLMTVYAHIPGRYVADMLAWVHQVPVLDPLAQATLQERLYGGAAT